MRNLAIDYISLGMWYSLRSRMRCQNSPLFFNHRISTQVETTISSRLRVGWQQSAGWGTKPARSTYSWLRPTKSRESVERWQLTRSRLSAYSQPPSRLSVDSTEGWIGSYLKVIFIPIYKYIHIHIYVGMYVSVCVVQGIKRRCTKTRTTHRKAWRHIQNTELRDWDTESKRKIEVTLSTETTQRETTVYIEKWEKEERKTANKET